MPRGIIAALTFAVCVLCFVSCALDAGIETDADADASFTVNDAAAGIDTADTDDATGDTIDNMKTSENEIIITVGGVEFTAVLADTDAARGFYSLLPLTIEMDELNGNEKYHYLDSSLAADASRPDRINAGDLMLYGSSCVVLFYESFSTSYTYTALGHITDADGLRDTLGAGSVTVTFSAK